MPANQSKVSRWSLYAGVCLVFGSSMTGCSVFESSYVVESEPGLSPNAVAAVDETFVAEPFSLVAADSVGLATFGFEIAQWADMPQDALAQH